MKPLRIRTAADLARAVGLGMTLLLTGHPFDDDRPVTPEEARSVIAGDTAEIITYADL